MALNLFITTEDGNRRVTEGGEPRITETQLCVLETDGGVAAGGASARTVSVLRTVDGGAVASGDAAKTVEVVRECEGGAVAGGLAKVEVAYAAPKFKDWLVKRLTPAKRETPRWADLARALQTFWETLFDPIFDKCYRMHSIYTADADDRLKIVADLGGWFEPDQPQDSLPAAVAMRKLELALKDTDYPIRAAIQRLGLGTSAEWLPLWALESDGDYGTTFYNEATGIPDGAYLTSRGVVRVSLEGAQQSDLDKIDAIVAKVKPLHIVYDGIIFTGTDYSIPFTRITEDGNPRITEASDYRITT